MLDSLHKLFEEHIKDLYNAEKQLVKALPKMAKGSSNAELRDAFEAHLEETRGHVDRLEQVAEIAGFKPAGKHCKGMEGLIEEGKEILEEEGEDAVIDAGLIAAAQKVEHYEISAYGTARAIAEQLGLQKVVDLLQETLDEESAADEKLSGISEGGALAQAAEIGDDQEDDDEERGTSRPKPNRRQPAKSKR